VIPGDALGQLPESHPQRILLGLSRRSILEKVFPGLDLLRVPPAALVRLLVHMLPIYIFCLVI